MESGISVLGTSPAVAVGYRNEKVGWLRRRLVPRDHPYLEWTIDGVPLRSVIAGRDAAVSDAVAPVRHADAPPGYEAAYLRALLGEPFDGDRRVMPDSGIPLLLCAHDFDLSCHALTTRLVVAQETVDWRDIAWQADWEPLDLRQQHRSALSRTFARRQYDETVRPLLRTAAPS